MKISDIILLICTIINIFWATWWLYKLRYITKKHKKLDEEMNRHINALDEMRKNAKN